MTVRSALALAKNLRGWVLNGENGVEIHVEGHVAAIDSFINDLNSRSPAAANVASGLRGTLPMHDCSTPSTENAFIREHDSQDNVQLPALLEGAADWKSALRLRETQLFCEARWCSAIQVEEGLC